MSWCETMPSAFPSGPTRTAIPVGEVIVRSVTSRSESSWVKVATPSGRPASSISSSGASATGRTGRPAADLPVRPVAEAPELLLDDAGRPRGWQLGDALAEPGTFTRDDSLRLVTDLTITSPTGIAVRVGPEGKADGIVSHHDIADHIARLKGRK